MGDLLDQIRSLMLEAIHHTSSNGPYASSYEIISERFTKDDTNYDLTVQGGSKAVLLIKDVKVDFKIVIDIKEP